MSKEPGTHTNLISNQNQKDTAIYIDSLFCKKKKVYEKDKYIQPQNIPKKIFHYTVGKGKKEKQKREKKERRDF